jgi:ubiquinone/menaquinone biosynthesis C-methylase UbiE
VLDAGCGTGLFTIACARARPGTPVVGVDLSAGMLAVAAAEARRRGTPNASFVRADAESLPFADGGFDAVLAAGLLPNVVDRASVVRELGRVLARAGRLHVVEFDRASMTPAVRAFFVTMILGYRCLSFVFRRFRFARRWSVETSTVEPRAVMGWAREAGLVLVSETARDSHRAYEFAKGEAGA